jgi:photosystem II stability/assembly factor-like uncharacterized protein
MDRSNPRASKKFAAALIAVACAAPLLAQRGAWTTSGPPGVTIEAFAIDPEMAGRIWAATAKHVIFRSDDSGTSWVAAGTGVTEPPYDTSSPDLLRIAVDPGNSDVVYAGGSLGFFKTVNSGRSWSKIDLSAFPDIELCTVSIAVGPDRTVLLVAGTRILRSTDGGDTWVAAEQANQGFPRVLVSTGRPGAFLNGGTAGVLRTTDSGATWHLTLAAGPGDEFDSIAVSALDPDSVLAATSAGSVFRSTDGGVSWTAASGAPQIALLARDPADPSIVYGAGQPGKLTALANLYRSRDGGLTWTEIPTPYEGVVHPRGPVTVALAVLEDHTVLDSGPDEGAFVSEDSGNTWRPSNRGLPGNTGGISMVGNVLADFDSGTGKLHSSAGHGHSWQLRNACVGAPAHACGAVLDFAIAATTTPTLYLSGLTIHSWWSLKSTDLGATWISLPLPLVVFVVDPADSATVFAPTYMGGELYRTSDSGESWNRIAPDLFPSAEQADEAVRVFPLGRERYLAVRFRNDPTATEEIFLSRDRGDQWTPVSGVSIPPGADDLGAFAVGGAETTIFLFQSYFLDGWRTVLFRSADEGRSWTVLPTPGSPSGLALDPQHPGRAYLSAASAGVFTSMDWGNHWSPLSNELPLGPGFSCGGLLLEPDGSYLHLSTSNGVYDLALPIPRVSLTPQPAPAPIEGRSVARP